MNLTRLLLVHAVVTLAAGIVLIAAPDLIPGSVGIQLNPSAYLIAYLLGAGEVSVAVLSFYGSTLKDRQALRVVCLTFIVLHGLTALVEIHAYRQGVSAKIWGNIGLRVVVAGLFGYYGFVRKQEPISG